ncbi:hypothetical protein [Arsenophonus sp. PmNCSU2021_1]
MSKKSTNLGDSMPTSLAREIYEKAKQISQNKQEKQSTYSGGGNRKKQ